MAGAEIIVTALKCAINIQDTPLAISVVSGETPASTGVSDATSLGNSVNFRSAANFGKPVLYSLIEPHPQ